MNLSYYAYDTLKWLNTSSYAYGTLRLLRFLDNGCVFKQANKESHMEVVARVLSLPIEEVYAKRHAIKRLRTRLNERAQALIAAWANEAVKIRSNRT